MRKIKYGIIGCGNISGIYFQASRTFEILEVAACADIIQEKAEAKAKEWNAPKACTVKQMLEDPEIDIILNLTVPKAHYEVSMAAIEAGKSVHSEKPLALTRDEGTRILDAAKKKKTLVGCAPDTFMGAGIQTCRKLIDDGWIGKPVAATAFMMCHGHESWHPDPEFYYKKGGGPMFDMGPYYLTALVNLLGPVERVSGITRVTFPERLITSQPKYGTKIDVEVPTHVVGALDFSCGAVGTIITSFDVWAHQMPCIEIYGTEGTLAVPDPNCFGGPVRLRRANSNEWREMPLSHIYPENSRGIGPADMAYSLRSGRPHRASGELAFHVLDVMQSIHESSTEGRHVKIRSRCERPAPLPLGLRHGILDE
ncbi:Gfo/Idh/MocA family oxidoreductase [Candidatus Sumerlaeota bacterium]|nr:Gfo/Idh/MocA family oxidoreductase [Candidatus Sumerlaeota bacterium]